MIYDYRVPYDDIMLIMNDGKKVAVTSPYSRDIHTLFFPQFFSSTFHKYCSPAVPLLAI